MFLNKNLKYSRNKWKLSEMILRMNKILQETSLIYSFFVWSNLTSGGFKLPRPLKQMHGACVEISILIFLPLATVMKQAKAPKLKTTKH